MINTITIIIALFAACFPTFSCFMIMIPEGFVGVQFRFLQVNGELLKPGLNFYNWFTTRVELVETRPQTDVVENVSCGTNDGVHTIIKRIEIGNQLPESAVLTTVKRFGLLYDKYLVTDLVIHEIGAICSKQSAHEVSISRFDEIDDFLSDFLRKENKRQETGLQINFVRPTRPELPSSLNKYYLEVAEEKTMKKVLDERRERIKQEKDNELLVAQKDNEIALQKQKQLQEEAKIQNEMLIEQAQAKSEAEKLSAASTKEFYSIPGYASVETAKYMSNNTKIYYGDKLPSNYPLLMESKR